MEQNTKSKRFSLLTQNANNSSSTTVCSNAQSSAQLFHCEVTLFKEKMSPSAVTRNSKDFFFYHGRGSEEKRHKNKRKQKKKINKTWTFAQYFIFLFNFENYARWSSTLTQNSFKKHFR